MTEVTIQPANSKTRQVYSIGDCFHHAVVDELYMIVRQMDGSGRQIVALVSLNTGNLWDDPVAVKDMRDIDETEILKVLGDSSQFVHLSSIKITYTV